MRVIAGSAGGVPLRTLDVEGLRPMLDRVKEALFNILRGHLQDATVLDLFSGSGSLGIEALSRGAESCRFVENDRRLADLIRSNLNKCNLAGRASVLEADVLELSSHPLPDDDPAASLCLADPPYSMMERRAGRQQLIDELEAIVGPWLRPDAVLVVHHPPPGPDSWPGNVFEERDRRTYGRSTLTFFRACADSERGV